jgi:hypothetical protein
MSTIWLPLFGEKSISQHGKPMQADQLAIITSKSETEGWPENWSAKIAI